MGMKSNKMAESRIFLLRLAGVLFVFNLMYQKIRRLQSLTRAWSTVRLGSLFLAAQTALAITSQAYIPATASPSRLATPGTIEQENVIAAQSLTDRFESLPAGKRLKKRPTDVKIYEFDREPIGKRSPFLMVHGLRGEYWPYFRWQKVADKLVKNPDFNASYKIYMVRYSSLDRIETVLPKFKEAFNHLYEVGKNRPIGMLALSMGGNLSYEALTDKDIEPKVKMLFTMGTPFHGSPLFCRDWMSYTLYKRLSWPWSRIDHSLAIRLYFSKNPALRKDLTWDNADAAIPDVGPFWSKLPFGPSGRLTLDNTENQRLIKVNSLPVDRTKLITYGGYILNPYLAPRGKRFVETAFFYPLFLMSTTFPAHVGREHPVLDMLNRDIANVQVPAHVAKAAGTPFVYDLNDGITPVTSAIFIQPDLAKQNYVAREADVEKLRGKLDVGRARIFRNVDHLTFIDGVRPLNPISFTYTSNHVKDELNPHETPRDIFDWIVGDILEADAKSTAKLANKEKLEGSEESATVVKEASDDNAKSEPASTN